MVTTFQKNMSFTSKEIKILPTLVAPIQRLQPVFADQYQGEWINYSIGSKIDRVFYEPKNQFFRSGGRAIVLGNSASRLHWPIIKFNRSNKHRRLINYNVLYGCNRAFEEPGELDFLTVSNNLLATEVPKSLHQICYSNQENVRINPKMNLLPLHQRFDAGTSAVILACFHGAKKVFLFGFDGDSSIYAGTKFYPELGQKVDSSSWSENLYSVAIAYSQVEFYRVGKTPESARKMTVLPNYSELTWNEFVSYADL